MKLIIHHLIPMSNKYILLFKFRFKFNKIIIYFISIWENKSFDDFLLESEDKETRRFRDEKLNKIDKILRMQSKQIFLGMICMQYKAKLVNNLNYSCFYIQMDRIIRIYVYKIHRVLLN